MSESPEEGKRLMGRVLTSKKITFGGLCRGNVGASTSWLDSADICSLHSLRFPGRQSLPAEALWQRVSIQEFVDLYPNSSSPGSLVPASSLSTPARWLRRELNLSSDAHLSLNLQIAAEHATKVFSCSVSGASQGRGKDFGIKHKEQSGNHLL